MALEPKGAQSIAPKLTPASRPQPRDLPGPNPSRHVEPLRFHGCMAIRSQREDRLNILCNHCKIRIE